MKDLMGFIALIMWIGGVVLAKGFWSTFSAIIFPFYAWYLVIEKCIIMLGAM